MKNMNNNVTFSIIIPMYNMEKYIKKCLNSILVQDYNFYEIIVVDDGSKDRSLEIASAIAKNNSQIKVLHKENGGICSACQVGITEAKMDYIVFVDADDTLKVNALSIIARELVKDEIKIDVLQYGLEFSDGKDVIKTEIPSEYEINDNKKIIDDHYRNFPTPSLACRTFARDLFDDILYLGKNIGVDEIFIVQLLNKSQVLRSISEAIYCVLIRENSVSRSAYSASRIEEYIRVYRNILKICKKYNNSSLGYTHIKYMKLLIEIIREYHERDDLKKKLFDEYIKTYHDSIIFQEYKTESIKFRIKNALFYRYAKIKKGEME